MTSDVLLIPNFGAEEGAGWGAPAYRPADEGQTGSPLPGEAVQRTASRLWQFLFAGGSRCLGEPETAADALWPKGFGVRNPEPIFSWLDVHDHAVAWLNTPAAQRFAKDAERRLLGADPEVVERVHDKAFAHRVAVTERMLPACLEPCIAVLEPDAHPTHCANRTGRSERSKRYSLAGPIGRLVVSPSSRALARVVEGASREARAASRR